MSRGAALALAALLGLAHVALSVPLFALDSPGAQLWPFFPVEHPHGPFGWDVRSAWEYLKVLLLRRANLDPFRLSVELLVVGALVAWFPRARWLRRLAAAGYGLALLLLAYQHGFHGFFQREPALWEDWRLLKNLYHYLGDQWSWRWTGAALLALLGWGALVTVLALGLSRLARAAEQAWWVRPGAAALALGGLASVAWFGPARVDPVARLALAPLAHNARVSWQRWQEFEALAQGPVDERYEALMQVRLARRPNVALLMIEAYGELLPTCDTAPAYQALLARMEAQLTAAGYHQRTALSLAPVFGGQSWLSIATVQLGMRIDTVRKFELVENVGRQTPSLTRFFKENGYFTAAVQPGNTIRTGLKALDTFGRDLSLDAPALEYRGLRYGWQGIPDQYTLGLIGDLLPTLRQPWLLFSMSVSTHHPWDAPFVFVRDWKALQDPALDTAAAAAPWTPIEERGQIGPERAGYFHTVEYEWRALARLMEQQPGAETVFLVLGDHQPKLPCDGDRPLTWNTPLHVISRDRALVEAFAQHGFEEGLLPRPGLRPALRHEGLLSLLVHVFAGQWSAPGSPPTALAPEGIGLRALYR